MSMTWAFRSRADLLVNRLPHLYLKPAPVLGELAVCLTMHELLLENDMPFFGGFPRYEVPTTETLRLVAARSEGFAACPVVVARRDGTIDPYHLLSVNQRHLGQSIGAK